MPTPRQAWETLGRRDATAASLTKLRRDWELRRTLEREAAQVVAVLRDQGHSWAAIGAAVGMSRQAATKRWRHRPAAAGCACIAAAGLPAADCPGWV